jgi:diguanylate cyclase (GGDEF)-like protein
LRQQSTHRDPYELACEVGAAITASLALDDVLQTVARLVAKALDVWEVDLHEYYPETGTLVGSAIWAEELTPGDEAWLGTMATLEERPTYRATIVDRQILESYVDDEEDPLDRRLMEQWGELAAMTVPLVFQDAVVGCLTLIEKRYPRRFDDEERRLAALLAVPAATAVHNARTFRRQAEQTRHLTSLLDAGRALVTTLALDEVLTRVSREARRALDSDRCAICEADAGTGALVERATASRRGPAGEADELHGCCDLRSRGVAAGSMPDGEESLVTTVADPLLDDDTRAVMEVFGERTRLCVPLVYGGERLGLLVLGETERERRYTEEELDLARALAEQAAVAIARARLYEREGTQNARLLALLETSRAVAAALDPAEVLANARVQLAELLVVPEEDVVVALRAPDGRFVPPDEAAIAWEEAVEGGGPVGPAAALDGLDPVAAGAVTSLGPAQDAIDDLTTLVVPMVAERDAIGFIRLHRARPATFGHEEVELVQVVANQAAAALENARLYRAVERQAITDGLTGLYNHRYFYERLHEEFARSQRYGLPLSLLIIDVDDFKRFNDRYGHPAGDQVLAEVGRVLSSQIRRGIDFPARYGGEEFAVLLPNTARDGAHVVGARLARELGALAERLGADAPPAGRPAREVGERIRSSIADSGLEGVTGAGGTHVTVSIGIAAAPGQAAAPDELVRNADKALYLAKRSGKNRVETFEGWGGV